MPLCQVSLFDGSYEECSLDGKNNENVAESKYADIPRPDFMKKEEVKTGAARGTLYHLVMEHIPYERLDKDFDFALFIEEVLLSSPCSSLGLYIQVGISFPFSFAFHFSSFLNYL